MPFDPFTSRFGNDTGSTNGSWRRSEKFGRYSTISGRMSRSQSFAAGVSRASVYR